jgi:signal transduction histidine kinase/CheY-like chemotaxis protein
MAAQPKRYALTARRAFLSAIFVLLALLGGLVALGYYAYLHLETLLSPDTWANIQNAVATLALDFSLYAAALLAVTLLLAWLLGRWVAGPLNRLVTAVTGREIPLPVRAPGEIGQLARRFDELTKSLRRTAEEKEAQDRSSNEALRRLEGVLQVERELSTTLDAGQLTHRVALALRDAFDYERVGIALIEGETLAYYFSDDAEDDVFAPPPRAPLAERNVVGRAIRARAPVQVDDLRTETGLSPAPGFVTAVAELAMPVIAHGQALAAIVLQSSRSSAFGPQDQQQLAALAEPLAVALANARLFQAEQMRRQLAEAIYRVSQTLSAALAPEGVPELILDQLAQVLPYDRSALVLIDDEHLEVAAARGFASPQAVRGRLRLEETPLVAQIARQGQPVVLDDAQRDSRYRPLFGAPPARSWLGAPLLRQGHVIGVLMLENDQAGRFDEEELHAIAALSNQAAIAMENARLKFQLEVVTRVTQEVSTRDVSRELPGILRTIIHQIRRVVPCDYAALALYNEDDDSFTVETVYDFAVRDWSELPAGQRHTAQGTAWQTACRTAGPLVQSELSRSAFDYERRLAVGGLRSGVVVPIIGASVAVGTLDFASRQAGAYGQAQIATLLELTHYLGTALHNARLSREREETATKLARTQEHLNLVDKVRAVGQLASGVAHDFNNLLAGVLGNAQLLLYEIRDEDQRELLRVIERAAKDGAETVRRLQGFARMEHDTPMTEVRLDMLARDAIDLTRPRWRDVAQSRGSTIEIVNHLNAVAPIAGRPAELREVLTNLIINAVDALPKGGTITITTYDEHNADDTPGSVVVEVADTGTGMPPDVRARIFDPFFTTKGEQGTGLGLAVSMGIIQSHGGQIEVESQPGAGTRFTIRLPVRVAEQAGRRKVPRNVQIAPGHILFVESEAMVRDATMRVLTRWGHKVAQASGGVEALQQFAPDTFDVVISDLGMPDMNGWDLLGQIKQRDPRVPTILITGWGRQIGDDEARARGVDYIIEKPFDQDDLREVLAEAMAPK